MVEGPQAFLEDRRTALTATACAFGPRKCGSMKVESKYRMQLSKHRYKTPRLPLLADEIHTSLFHVWNPQSNDKSDGYECMCNIGNVSLVRDRLIALQSFCSLSLFILSFLAIR
jgi:hypothetical protein